jgi:hypothetical protein
MRDEDKPLSELWKPFKGLQFLLEKHMTLFTEPLKKILLILVWKTQ